MEEQRTDASPAPMIPLTIGSDFIMLFIWVLRYLNLAILGVPSLRGDRRLNGKSLLFGFC